jgi:hypothetical protein
MSSDQFRKEFNDLRRNNMIFRFSSEIQHCNDRLDIKIIRDIINKLQMIPVDIDSKENKMKEYLKMIDMSQYKKNWKRLKTFQQENRLLKFVEDHNISKDVRDSLFDMLEDNKLKHDVIDYNASKGEIMSIVNLEKNKDGEYQFVKNPKLDTASKTEKGNTVHNVSNIFNKADKGEKAETVKGKKVVKDEKVENDMKGKKVVKDEKAENNMKGKKVVKAEKAENDMKCKKVVKAEKVENDVKGKKVVKVEKVENDVKGKKVVKGKK